MGFFVAAGESHPNEHDAALVETGGAEAGWMRGKV